MLQGDEDIVMKDFKCLLPNHTIHSIYALCISGKCRNNATLCQQCFLEDDHSNRTCQNNLKNLNDIRNLLLELLKLQKEYKSLQEKINLIFDGVYSEIQKLLTPIYDYQKEPNLTNLNNIGLLLRTLPNNKIKHLIYQSEIEMKDLLEHKFRMEVQAQTLISDDDSTHVQSQQQNKIVLPLEGINLTSTIILQRDQEFYRQGCKLYEDKNYIKAIELLDKSIAINQNYQKSWSLKSCALCTLKYYDNAIFCIEKAIEINQDYFYCWYIKGITYLEQFFLGRILYYQKKNHQAIDALNTAIEKNPKYIYSRHVKGVALLKIHKGNQSVKCFEEIKKIDSNYNYDVVQKRLEKKL